MRARVWIVCGVVLLALAAWWRLDRTRPGERGEPSSQPQTSAPEVEPELWLQDGGAMQARSPVATAANPELASPKVEASARPGATISGIVFGPDQLPRRGAYLKFVWNDRGRMRDAHGTTGRDGRFELAIGDPRVRGDLLAYVYRHDVSPSALVGVEAGAHGLELELGPPSDLALEVRDQNEQPVVLGQATFYWQLAGFQVQDYPGGVAGGDHTRWVRSPVPFFVALSPYGYEAATFGPFDPAQVGDDLVLPVHAFARVAGMVVHDGVPIAGASVVLDAEGDKRNGYGFGASSDADGKFELRYRQAGRYVLRAFVVPQGEGRIGGLQLDGEQDVENLRIELTTPPGRIEGRVQLPNGHVPEEIWLSASGAPGERTLRSDGSFSLPDLPPGACRITVAQSVSFGSGPHDSSERWVSIADGPSGGPEWLGYEHVWHVDVLPGQTQRLEIDLTQAPACLLEGWIRLDGIAPALRPPPFGYHGGRDLRVFLDHGNESEFDSAAEIDSAGTFRLGVSEAGEFRLRLELPLSSSKDEEWLVVDRVALLREHQAWKLDAPTGSLLLLPRDEEQPLWFEGPSLRWEGAGDLRIEVNYPELDEARGSRLYRHVPAGKVRFEVGRGADARELECEIRAGETTEVRWPQ
ncbi:MAG: carboxypeptidase regulatory-like domain-containing protein [Planctomycetes bacterium]|nr:carboxypeptidase regulatory-like domain-containing protein [Planctomycetota bacterium]